MSVYQYQWKTSEEMLETVDAICNFKMVKLWGVLLVLLSKGLYNNCMTNLYNKWLIFKQLLLLDVLLYVSPCEAKYEDLQLHPIYRYELLIMYEISLNINSICLGHCVLSCLWRTYSESYHLPRSVAIYKAVLTISK